MLISRWGYEKEYPLWRYALLYSEIKGKLDEYVEKYPGKISYCSAGKTHMGRDIYVVTVAEDTSKEAMHKFVNERQRVAGDPDGYLANHADKHFKVPVVMNCNTHASEISGTDGAFTLLDEVLGTTEGQALLKDLVLIINICVNPDGRSRGIDVLNGHGMDLNRDYAAQTQPETRAIVESVMTKYYPVSFLCCHGFMVGEPIMVDGCTEPHNPDTEYDLIEANNVAEAKAAAAVITERTGFKTTIPAMDLESGWDDYGLSCSTSVYTFFGCLCHTLETSFPDLEGAQVCHAGMIGVMRFAAANKEAIQKNQCTYFKRGIENMNPRKDTLYYVFPNNRKEQRDLSAVADIVRYFVRNGVRVYKDAKGDVVIPVAQPMRGYIHANLGEGEDVTPKMDNMYDISITSMRDMRGLTIIEETAHRPEGSLIRIQEPGEFFGVIDKKSGAGLAICCLTMDGYKLAVELIKQGADVYRSAERTGDVYPGDFILKDHAYLKYIDEHKKNRDIRVIYADPPSKLQKMKLPKIAVVSDGAGPYETLLKLGLDVTSIPFSELNSGYRINMDDYDLFMYGGCQYTGWEDAYVEYAGAGYGVSWGLRNRGRDYVFEAAEAANKLLLFGYAGARLAKELKKYDMTFRYTVGFSGDPKLIKEDAAQSFENGTFRFELDPAKPICYGYKEQETFYAVCPVCFPAVNEGDVSGKYSNDAFKFGFCKNAAVLNGEAVFLSKEDCVLLGIDPSFRSYTPAGERLLANAVFALFYESII